MDSAAIGDVVAAQWWIYSRGFGEEWLTVHSSVRNLRVLRNGYTNAGLPVAADQEGHVNVQGFPNSIGRGVSIQLYENRRMWSRMSHMPHPTMSVLNSNEVAWPLVAPEMRSPYLGEKIAILGGHPGLGRCEQLERADCCEMIRSFYPQAVARHGLWAAVRHFEYNRTRIAETMQEIQNRSEHTPPNQGRAGNANGYIPSGRFFTDLVHKTFGTERMHAILSSIAPATRGRYLSAWKHWVIFTHGQNKNPWILRSTFNWDDDLIDFMLFEAKMMGNTAPTISAKISALRFWHLISGYPDFSLGGGRYRFVLKGLRRENIERREKSL